MSELMQQNVSKTCLRPERARCNDNNPDQCCGGGAGEPCDCPHCHPSPNAVDFDKWWSSTNNSNFFSNKTISTDTLKRVSREVWFMSRKAFAVERGGTYTMELIKQAIIEEVACIDYSIKDYSHSFADRVCFRLRPQPMKDRVTIVIVSDDERHYDVRIDGVPNEQFRQERDAERYAAALRAEYVLSGV